MTGTAWQRLSGLSAFRVAADGYGLRLTFHWETRQAGKVRVRAVRADGALVLETQVPAGDAEVRVPLAAGRRDVLLVQWTDGVHSHAQKVVMP